MSYSTVLTELEDKFLLFLFNVLNDKSTIFKLKFFLIEISLDETNSVANLNVGLVV